MGADERDDSDVHQADGRTASFSYEGGTDHSWDAGLILIETAMAWTPTPNPTATPMPSPTPDPALALRENLILKGSQVIKFTRFDDSGAINPDGRYTSDALEAGDPLLETVPFFLVDPFNNMYLGFAGELEGLAINFSGYFSGDGAYQPRIVFNFAMDESAAPSFETENMHFGEDPDVDVDTELMLSNLRVNLEDFHDARSISLWIYRAIFDDDGEFVGHKLVHVALSESELAALIEQMEMASDLEEEDLEEGALDEGYIVGTVYRFEGEEIVEVSLGEALDALDEAMLYGRIPMDPEVREVWQGYVRWVENIEIN
jgi:hypothetical protein